MCGARRGTLSQREKVTGRAFDRQIGSTKRGDRYANCRIRTGFSFDRPICYATGDRKWSSGESRLIYPFSNFLPSSHWKEIRDGRGIEAVLP